MQTIKTANGIELAVDWCGVAGIDGVLRFYVPNCDLARIMQIFADPASLPVTHLFDDKEVETYTDFTQFFGATKDFNGGVIAEIARAA